MRPTSRLDTRTARFPRGDSGAIWGQYDLPRPSTTRQPSGFIGNKNPALAGLFERGPYGIRTRAAAVRGRCPRPLDEWAVRAAIVANGFRRRPAGRALSERLLDLPPVDSFLEPTADLLTRRKEIVVAPAARREVDDPDALVAIAMTACIGGRLVEGPQAIALPPQPCHTRTPTTFRVPWEPGRTAGFRTLQTKRGR